MMALRLVVAGLLTASLTSAWTVVSLPRTTSIVSLRMGYLDQLSKEELYSSDDDGNERNDSREATQMAKEQIDRYGPGDLSQFVDFNEFDGGDGQMGVAGDGKQGLDKEWDGAAELVKSKSMSARNAWGKSTGYADQLMEQGVEQSRAQQLENWKNQRQVQEQRNHQKWMTDEFDNKPAEEDWRSLSTFTGAQVQDTDMDQTLGTVQPGPVTAVIELTARLNQAAVYEFSLKNPFMGFSDFRARFTYMTNPADWSVSPTDGSLNGRGDPTQFLVKFRPQSPSRSEGFLVVETEEDKWTYQLIGTASM